MHAIVRALDLRQPSVQQFGRSHQLCRCKRTLESPGADRVVSKKAFMGGGCWLDIAGGGGVLVPPLLTAAGTCTSPQSNRQSVVQA